MYFWLWYWFSKSLAQIFLLFFETFLSRHHFRMACWFLDWEEQRMGCNLRMCKTVLAGSCVYFGESLLATFRYVECVILVCWSSFTEGKHSTFSNICQYCHFFCISANHVHEQLLGTSQHRMKGSSPYSLGAKKQICIYWKCKYNKAHLTTVSVLWGKLQRLWK